MRYNNIQKAPVHFLLLAISIIFFTLSITLSVMALQITFAISGSTILLLGLSFQHLITRDESDSLLISFGPISLFKRRIHYANIERVEMAKSTILDGWGIHMSPSGGWTWNLWGFDCVDVWFEREGKTRKIRIGTNDPSGLHAFLSKQISR